MRYAGMTRRLLALLIDSIVIIGFYSLLGLIFGQDPIFYTFSAHFDMVGLWFFSGLMLFSTAYFVLFESSSWQATIGKRMLGLKVATLKGNRIGILRALVRRICKFLPLPTIVINFFMILFTKKKQALHDKIASTVILVK